MPGPICLKFCTDHLWTIVEGTVSQNFYFLSESWDIGHQKWRLDTFFTNWLWLVINSILFPLSKIWDTVPCIFAIRICGQNLTSLAFQVFEKSPFEIKIIFFVKKICHVTKQCKIDFSWVDWDSSIIHDSENIYFDGLKMKG